MGYTVGRSSSKPVASSAAESDRLGVDGAAHDVGQFLPVDRFLLEEEVDDGVEGDPTLDRKSVV